TKGDRMSLYSWLNKRSKTLRSRPKPPRGPFRPSLEALEDRLVLDTRIWSGGDPFSANWSAYLNWKNGALFPDPPVKQGDSVDFPADASRRTNSQDFPSSSVTPLIIGNLHIEGGNYDIGGLGLDFTSKLISDSGNNTIRDSLIYIGNQFGNTVATIDVGSDSLTLGGLTSRLVTLDGRSRFAPADLIKTGAGTLRITEDLGEPAPIDTDSQQGEVPEFAG